MSEYIPFEIQEEILKRLPLKPLIQFRTVSKSYKRLIDSQDFINSHSVHHHLQQPHDRFILRYELYPREERYISLVDNDDSIVQQEFIPPVPDLIKTFIKNFHDPLFESLVGSSNGLLCFNGKYPDGHFSDNYDGTEMVVLWNPSIRKSVGIRVPYMYEKPSENFCNLNVDNVFGFGVCPVTFDPTIIKITCIAYKRNRYDTRRTTLPWEVGVFTLSTGTWNTGTWSILSTKLPHKSIKPRGSQVVIDRFIYWVAYDILDAENPLSQSYFLIMFDLTAKKFKEINITDSFTNRHCCIQSISKLKESLVLLEYNFEEDVPAHCLWMMKEQGVSTSFTKMYTINLPDATVHRILGFRKTGDLIMEIIPKHEDYGEVQIYKQKYEYFDNLGIDGEENSFFMCSYMETLLLLDKSDGYIYLPIVRT